MKVYLAGGMRSNWQDEVVAGAPGHEYLDPRRHGFWHEDYYTLWDLAAIEKCDLVFAYLERSNPSGLGMALEIGYAKALGKRIIFVDETAGTSSERYSAMMRVCADTWVSVLPAAIVLLASLA